MQLWEFEPQIYGEIDKQIAAARQQEENAIASSNTWVKKLAEIRKDFEAIKLYITKATENRCKWMVSKEQQAIAQADLLAMTDDLRCQLDSLKMIYQSYLVKPTPKLL